MGKRRLCSGPALHRGCPPTRSPWLFPLEPNTLGLWSPSSKRSGSGPGGAGLSYTSLGSPVTVTHSVSKWEWNAPQLTRVPPQ